MAESKKNISKRKGESANQRVEDGEGLGLFELQVDQQCVNTTYSIASQSLNAHSLGIRYIMVYPIASNSG